MTRPKVAFEIAVYGHRPEEWRVIEGVEGLPAELKRLGLRQGDEFQECQVEIDHVRFLKGAVRCDSASPERIHGEERGTEIGESAAKDAIDVQRTIGPGWRSLGAELGRQQSRLSLLPSAP